MTVTAKPLVSAKEAETTQTTQYTAPAGTRVILDKVTGTNTGAGSAQLSFNLVPLGGSAGASNTVVKTKALSPGECYTFPEIVGHVLAPGDFVSTLASAASVTIRISGREVT
jgi:hypothetical protein